MHGRQAGVTAELEDAPDYAEQTRLHLEDLLRFGLSQRAFASMTGIPRSTIGDFLRGTHEPSERTLTRIAEVLYPEDYGRE